jgi:hypothetical protein
MRRARIAVLIVLFAAFTAVSAQAVTLKDIIELTKAGLGDDVLLALIEVDGGVFDVDTATLTRLKAAGVSEKVIVALVRSGRVRPAADEPQTLTNVVAAQQAPEVTYQAPEVTYIERPTTTIVREVAVPVPVYIGIPVNVRGPRVHHGHDGRFLDGRFSGDRVDVLQPSFTAPPLLQSRLPTYLTDTPPPPKKRQPEYWGFGGKLRPDAWKPQ